MRRVLTWPVVVFAVFAAHHIGAACWAAARQAVSMGEVLARWDALHYARIATDGYDGSLWAFLPLYPALLRVVGLPAQALTGARLELVGAWLSLGLFAAFVGVASAAAQAARTDAERALTPQRGLEWILLVYSPASYVFFTAHTEALFLLLSFAALWSASRQRAWAAGLAAGLAALTRNQGVLVALVAAFWCWSGEGAWPVRVRRAATVALVSGACFTAYLVFQYAQTSNALSFLAAQQHWPHATSLEDALRALTFLNPRQPATAINVVDFVLFWLLAALTVRLFFVQRNLAAYAALSLLLVPLQSETTNVARFGTVLFPLWLEAGRLGARLPRWAQALLVVGAVVLNNWFTQRYLKGAWAY
ncbi:MAG: mannosyltransferase family protein [Myxococcota bacterium]